MVVLGWIGATRFTTEGAAALAQLLTQNGIIGGLLADVGATIAARLIGGLQVVTAFLLALGSVHKRVSVAGAGLAAGLTAAPITLLLTNPVWIDALGGFPAIGSGQGIIKYPALCGLALFVLAFDTGQTSLRRHATSIAVAGVILPLVWIGGMKFTAIEAAGVEPLLSTSPFLSWMLRVFGTQGASNVIGVTELVTVAVLASWWYRPHLYPVAAFLTSVTFLTTLSFLITLPGWHENGFPLLSSAGMFVIKDLGLLAAGLIPLAMVGEPDPNLNSS